MRPMKLVASAVLASVFSAGAYADWTPAGPYTFLQDQPYELFFDQPGTELFLAADFSLQYSSLVYDSIELLPGSLAALLNVVPVGPRPVTPAVTPELREFKLEITPAMDLDFDQALVLPAGTLFGVRFHVLRNASLDTGAGDVVGQGRLTFADAVVPEAPVSEVTVPMPVNVSASIVAVPEPKTWAAMLAGLALIGVGAVRARRNSVRLGC